MKINGLLLRLQGPVDDEPKESILSASFRPSPLPIHINNEHPSSSRHYRRRRRRRYKD